MRKVFRFWKIFLFDLVGVAFMLLAIATGWLPGPGGIPLFIIGLSILAIHHDWAQKYIDNLRDYVEKIGKQIFTDDKDVQLGYDIVCPFIIAGGAYFLWLHNATWQISIGIFMVFTGVTLLAGNRDRFNNFKKKFSKKHK